MRPITLFVLSLPLTLLVACNGGKSPDTGTATPGDVDADGDGSLAADDCDDADGTRFPGAEERCNDLDDDCDGAADEDPIDPTTLYADTDGDGFGDPDAAVTTCDSPAGHVAAGDDCDDTDPAVNPGAAEVCDDADVDEDCSGSADDADAGVDASTGSTWYADADGDGYGDGADASMACDMPAGRVADGSDCDDARSDVHPEAIEICDAADTDEDCDGATDDADPDVDLESATDWFEDADADGYGDPDRSLLGCDAPEGYVADATDCGPTRADVSPAGTEACDDLDVDEDCDGGADNADPGALGESTWFADADADGFGDAAAPALACDQPTGQVADATDCDDTSASTHPGAEEQCDGVPNDCDTAAAWTTDAELGVASWAPVGGAWSAVTADFAAATADAPITWTPPADGELVLCAGTHYAMIDGSGYDLTITGLAGSAATTLDAAGAGSVVTSTGGTISLAGVTLQNGAASDGAGLYALASSVTLSDVTVRDSAATGYGGGLFLQSCNGATLADVVLASDSASTGGGLYLANSTGVVLERVTASGNTAQTSGGGLAFSNSAVTLTDGIVSDNSASNSYTGGGLFVRTSTVSLTSVSVSGNAAGTGGGLYASASTLDVVAGDLTENTALGAGAAFYAYYASTLAFTGTDFVGNVSGGGAPVLLDTNTTATFDTCAFTTNAGDTSGVFGFASTASTSFVASDFSGNVPNDAYAGGAGYSFGTAASGTCDDTSGCY